MFYNYISTHFYVTCLVLYAWYKVNLETFIFLKILYYVFTPLASVSKFCNFFLISFFSHKWKHSLQVEKKYEACEGECHHMLKACNELIKPLQGTSCCHSTNLSNLAQITFVKSI